MKVVSPFGWIEPECRGPAKLLQEGETIPIFFFSLQKKKKKSHFNDDIFEVNESESLAIHYLLI